jgi:hypothetical protein
MRTRAAWLHALSPPAGGLRTTSMVCTYILCFDNESTLNLWSILCSTPAQFLRRRTSNHQNLSCNVLILRRILSHLLFSFPEKRKDLGADFHMTPQPLRHVSTKIRPLLESGVPPIVICSGGCVCRHALLCFGASQDCMAIEVRSWWTVAPMVRWFSCIQRQNLATAWTDTRWFYASLARIYCELYR